MELAGVETRGEMASGEEQTRLSLEAKKREVLQLLRDYRAFYSAGGGAMAPEDTHMTSAAYGPAGMVFTGRDFEPPDRRLLSKSYEKLNAALRLLRRDHMELWVSLVEPYLADPADPSLVDHWRQSVACLDAENALIRKKNDAARKAAKRKGESLPTPQSEKRGLVWTRLQVERHDAAIEKLAEYLRGVDLYHVPPKLMSEREEATVERQNAEIHAVYQRLRVSGLRETAAIEQTAQNFRVLPATVERIIEFRAHLKLASCMEEGCGGEVYQQNLCVKHYTREYRARKRRAG